MHNPKATIAVFDFDGTITEKDTFFDFVVSARGFIAVLIAVVKNFPFLSVCLLAGKKCDAAKEKLFSDLFSGFPLDEFNRICRQYSLGRIPELLRKKAAEKISWHRQMGHKLVIVSASLENMILPWAENNGFERVIATSVQESSSILTGKFKTKNCNREEKVARFLKEYPNRKDYFLYVYGDSWKDRPLMGVADKKFYKSF